MKGDRRLHEMTDVEGRGPMNVRTYRRHPLRGSPAATASTRLRSVHWLDDNSSLLSCLVWHTTTTYNL